MNEANHLHDDLLHAMLPLIPKSVYQDLRRMNTLAWAVTSLCLTHTVRLWAWAEVLESRAQYAASRVRRFSELSASSSDPASGVVFPDPASSPGRLATKRSRLCSTRYDGPDPLCLDPRLAHLPRSCYSAGLASHAAQECQSRECRTTSQCLSRCAPSGYKTCRWSCWPIAASSMNNCYTTSARSTGIFACG